jgi:hypothetical protein
VSDTYKIGTTDLTTVFTEITEVQGGVGLPPMLQEDYVIPGRNGAVAAEPYHGPLTLTIQGVIIGAGTTPATKRVDALTKLQTLSDLVYGNGSTYTVTRTIGTSVATATGRYLGGLETVGFEAPHVLLIQVEISILEGVWAPVVEEGEPEP